MKFIRNGFTDRDLVKSTRKIFYFSLLSSFLTTANIFIDQFVAGNLGASAIAGIGVVSFTMPILFAARAFIGQAFAGHMAQSLTSKHKEHAQKTFDFIMFVSLLFILVFGLIMWGAKDWLIGIRTSDAVVIANASDYYWFGVGTILFTMLSGRYSIFLSVKGKESMRFLIQLLAILVNVGISVGLTYGAHMGVIGTGIGTAVSVIFAFFIRFGIVLALKVHSEIKINPFRFIFAKMSHIRILKKTWFYFPYEFIYFTFIFIESFAFNTRYINGLLIYSVVNSMIFSLIAVSGMSTLLNRFVSPLLSKGKVDEAMEMNKKLLAISTVRSCFFGVVVVMTWGLILPYIGIYHAPIEMIKQAGYIIAIVGPIAITLGPLFFAGYGIAALSANPLKSIVLDLVSKGVGLGIAFAAAEVSGSWISMMVALLTIRVLSDISLGSIVFMRKQYVSLQKEME